MVLLLTVAVTIVQAVPSSNIIRSTNHYDFTLGWTVGVTGGIPSDDWPIFRTLSDTVSAVQANAHFAACPSGQVVKLLDGNYSSLAGSLQIAKSGVVVRGEGTNTVIPQAIIITGSDELSNWAPIHSGATKGSTNFVIVPGNLTPEVGDTFVASEKDAPGKYWVGTQGAGGTNVWSQSFRITAVGNGTNITVATPNARALTQAAFWKVKKNQIRYSGYENLQIKAPSADSSISLLHAQDVWVRGVTIVSNGSQAIYTLEVLNHELTHNKILWSASGGDGYGYNAQKDPDRGVSSSGGAVYNNAYVGQYHGVLLTGFSVGFVGYDWHTNENAASAGVQFVTAAVNYQHFWGVGFVLLEGIYGGYILGDSIHGNATDIFINGCRLTGQTNSIASYANAHQAMIWTTTNNTDFTIHRNVLGDVWMTNTWADYKYDGVEWNAASTTENGAAIMIGYLHGVVADPDVVATLVCYHNYDFKTGTTTNETAIAGDPSKENSWIFTSKPSWFGSKDFPPFDPSTALTDAATDLPIGDEMLTGAQQGEGESGGTTLAKSGSGKPRRFIGRALVE